MKWPEQRVCSKCGAVRDDGVERCPECGTRRSRKLRRKAGSFWVLSLADRRKLAEAMYRAILRDMREDEAGRLLFVEHELPYFKEFRRYNRLLRWSRITDGEERINHEWYKQKPDPRFNPFTGLRWPPRDL